MAAALGHTRSDSHICIPMLSMKLFNTFADGFSVVPFAREILGPCLYSGRDLSRLSAVWNVDRGVVMPTPI